MRRRSVAALPKRPSALKRRTVFAEGRAMSMKKIVSLITAICVLLIGLAIIVAAIMNAEIPKPLWLLFAVCNLVNAIMILTGFRKK